MSAEPLKLLPEPLDCPQCEEARRLLMDERIRRQDLERDMASKRAIIRNLERELAGKRSSDPHWTTAEEIWRYWKEKCRPRARTFSDDQARAVLARLREKLPGTDEYAYPPRFICEAILGASVDHFIGDNGKHHNDLELVCRNSAKLMDFHERWERWKARQPNA